MKICKTCSVKKSEDEFYKDKTSDDGLRCNCKACMRDYKNQWQRENNDRVNLRQRALRAKTGYHMKWYYRNKEKVSAYHRLRRERIGEALNARGAKWRRLNPEKHVAFQSERRALKLSAKPLWADDELISDMYKEARYFGLVIDHMVPLKSRYVCGLHCEQNLQAISRQENARKHNSFWPDMWR